MSFWSKFKKIAGFVAPFAAMAIPGLQGFGAAALLGRAGVGAATGALGGGGLRGALLGAGTGAALGGFGGAGKAASGVEKFALPGAVDAMNGVAHNPSIWSRLGGAVAKNVVGGLSPQDIMSDGHGIAGGVDPGGAGSGGFWGRLAGAALSKNGIGALGGMARAGAEGREKGRENDLRNYGHRNDIDLSQRQFQENSQTDAYRKAMGSALALNLKDAHFARPNGVQDTGMTGGLRPSAIGQQGHDAAAVLNKQAMQRLLDGEHFDKLPGYKGNAIDSILGTAGVITGGIDDYNARNASDKHTSIIDELLKQQAQQPAGAPTAPVAPGQPPLTPSVTTSESVPEGYYNPNPMPSKNPWDFDWLNPTGAPR